MPSVHQLVILYYRSPICCQLLHVATTRSSLISVPLRCVVLCCVVSCRLVLSCLVLWCVMLCRVVDPVFCATNCKLPVCTFSRRCDWELRPSVCTLALSPFSPGLIIIVSLSSLTLFSLSFCFHCHSLHCNPISIFTHSSLSPVLLSLHLHCYLFYCHSSYIVTCFIVTPFTLSPVLLSLQLHCQMFYCHLFIVTPFTLSPCFLCPFSL
jgi:hypothetical protein